MKQVTMESIQKRIADLESAGKVVGGLSLSSEFELACLRELVAVTEQRDALVVENVKFKSAAKETLAHWAAAEPSEMESMMDKCMPALRVAYCETPATDAQLAALRTEAIAAALDNCSEYSDGDCVMESNGVSYEEAQLRAQGAVALSEALLRTASQLRESKGASHED